MKSPFPAVCRRRLMDAVARLVFAGRAAMMRGMDNLNLRRGSYAVAIASVVFAVTIPAFQAEQLPGVDAKAPTGPASSRPATRLPKRARATPTDLSAWAIGA
jgi:hypothetical protein